MHKGIRFLVGAAAAALVANSAHASLITDGDFEQGLTGTGGNTTFVGWYLQNGSGVAPATQAVSNASSPYQGTYSAQLATGIGAELQNLSSSTTSAFTISFVTASTSNGTAGTREFQFIAGDRTTTGNASNDVNNDTKINLIVNVDSSNTATGDVEVNTGSGFVTPSGFAQSFNFSSSLSSPVWNSIVIQGVMNGTNTSYYSVTVNGIASGTIAGFQTGGGSGEGAIPTSLARIAFNSESSLSSFDVDTVSVTPEPASLALFGIGALGLLRRKQKSSEVVA